MHTQDYYRCDGGAHKGITYYVSHYGKIYHSRNINLKETINRIHKN